MTDYERKKIKELCVLVSEVSAILKYQMEITEGSDRSDIARLRDVMCEAKNIGNDILMSAI